MFLEIIKAILMGIVEGITEWLPISSTGHMILLEQVVKFNASEEFMSMFRVVIQLGAILAVVVLFWGKLWPFGLRHGRVISKPSVWQMLAIIPGTSRSGATIVGGLLLGLSRACVAEFTFFLAIPVMAGASLLKVVKFVLSGAAMTGTEVAVLVVGCVVAFVVSLVAIRFLMDYVKRHNFKFFGLYRIVLGAIVLAVAAITAIA